MNKRKSWKLKQDSFSKMIIWFADGNVRTLYSIDWKHKYSKNRDAKLGLDRFYTKIKQYGEKAQYCMIYDLQTNSTIGKFYKGEPVEF